jgi:hypothetical protein
LKGWPASKELKAWVKKNKPNELSLKIMLDCYNEMFEEIAEANP